MGAYGSGTGGVATISSKLIQSYNLVCVPKTFPSFQEVFNDLLLHIII